MDKTFTRPSPTSDGLETDRTPWVIVLQNLRHIENLIYEEPELLALFEQFQRALLLKTYEAVGWARPRQHAARQLQPELLHAACRLRIANCTEEALQRFYRWLQEPDA